MLYVSLMGVNMIIDLSQAFFTLRNRVYIYCGAVDTAENISPVHTSKTGRFAWGEDGSRGTFRSRA
jgi:hypothetical protein